VIQRGLRQHGGGDTPGRPPQQVPDERAADAEAQHHKLRDAEVIHQAELVIGMRVPRPVDLERAAGFAAIGVAQIHRDNAVLALELVHRVEGVVREARDRGVQPAPGDHQQREAGADLLVMNTDFAFFVERHGVSPFPVWVSTRDCFVAALLAMTTYRCHCE